MNDVVGLAECLDLCEALQRQMESDCQIPPDCLGGEMRPAYERVRENQLVALKSIYYQLCALLDNPL